MSVIFKDDELSLVLPDLRELKV